MQRPRIIPAVSVALLRGATFLLVLRGREPGQGLWAFPGGKIDPGETAEKAARRELEEETGLSADSLALFETVELAARLDGEPVLFRLEVFAGHWSGGEAKAGDDAEALGWFAVGEMAALPAAESTVAVARAVLDALRAPH